MTVLLFSGEEKKRKKLAVYSLDEGQSFDHFCSGLTWLGILGS
jgi:hypothetical protein